jgi:hypothetical protein
MDDVVGIVGHDTHQIDEFNKQDIQLGSSRLDPDLINDVENAIKQTGDTNGLIERFKSLKGQDDASTKSIPLPP